MPSDDSDKDIMTPSEDEMEDNEKPNAKQKKTKKKKTTNGHKDLSATNVGCSSREAYIQTACVEKLDHAHQWSLYNFNWSGLRVHKSHYYPSENEWRN